uniref:Major facilitator superfamily (MFS) profile domain-containing protein n=1 Tax=Glycine max TaxID=3847 RepID=A0A0R0ELR6_SOYBN
MSWLSGIRELRPLLHLLLPLSIHWVAEEMTVSVLVDVTTSALCPGESTCSKAIYINGVQQTIVGIFKMVVLPLLGQLSDEYGRKPLLLITISTAIFPFDNLICFAEVLSVKVLNYFFLLYYSRLHVSEEYVDAYYVLHTISNIISQGSIFCISVAYAADVVNESKRAAVFSWITGCWAKIVDVPRQRYISMRRAAEIVIFSPTLRGIALVSFFYELGMSGISNVLLMLLLPILNPLVGEKVILCSALLASIAYAWLYGFTVPYLSASFVIIYVLVKPATYAIISNASSSTNQNAEMRRCWKSTNFFIAGTQSISDLLSPIAMSPLTSWFLSSNAAFECKGFSIICAFICMIISLCFACILKPDTDTSLGNDIEGSPETPLLSDN